MFILTGFKLKDYRNKSNWSSKKHFQDVLLTHESVKLIFIHPKSSDKFSKSEEIQLNASSAHFDYFQHEIFARKTSSSIFQPDTKTTQLIATANLKTYSHFTLLLFHIRATRKSQTRWRHWNESNEKRFFFPPRKRKKLSQRFLCCSTLKFSLLFDFLSPFFSSQQGESGKAPREKWILRNICYCSARIETSVGTFMEKFSHRALTNRRKGAFHSALFGCLCWWKLSCFTGISDEKSTNFDIENTENWEIFRRFVQRISFLVRNLVFMSRLGWNHPSCLNIPFGTI